MNYVDARTPEEKANEPKGTFTTSANTSCCAECRFYEFVAGQQKMTPVCKNASCPCHQSNHSKGWKAKFDELFAAEINTDPSSGQSSLQLDLKAFISKLLSDRENEVREANRGADAHREAYRNGVAAGATAERATWINQPYNAHDERIRQAERARILAVLEEAFINRSDDTMLVVRSLLTPNPTTE